MIQVAATDDETVAISRRHRVVATLMQSAEKPKPIGAFLRWLSENRHLDDEDAADFEKLVDELRREEWREGQCR